MSNDTLVPKLRFKFSSDWESKKLKDIIQISKEKYNPNTDKTNYKCIELEHLSQETGVLLGFTDSTNQNSIKNKFHEGNILFGKLRPYLKKFYYPNFDGVCSSEIWVFNTNEYSKYIYYLIQTKKFLDISNVSSGSKMPRSDWKFMKDFLFSIPDLKTQKETVNLFSMIDNKIKLLENKHQQYQNFKNYLMQQIFTQKIRFEEFDDEWEIKKLDDLSKIQRGASPRPITSKKWYDTENKNVGWVRISDVTNSVKYLKKTEDYFSEEGIKKSRFIPKGSLIMSICATIGKPIITNIDTCIHDGFVGFSELNINKEFLYYYLNILEPKFVSLSQTGSQANLNSDLVKITKISVPTFEEQEKIVDFLSNIDKKIELMEKYLEKYIKFKKGLLQQMFV